MLFWFACRVKSGEYVDDDLPVGRCEKVIARIQSTTHSKVVIDLITTDPIIVKTYMHALAVATEETIVSTLGPYSISINHSHSDTWRLPPCPVVSLLLFKLLFRVYIVSTDTRHSGNSHLDRLDDWEWEHRERIPLKMDKKFQVWIGVNQKPKCVSAYIIRKYVNALVYLPKQFWIEFLQNIRQREMRTECPLTTNAPWDATIFDQHFPQSGRIGSCRTG